MAKPPTNSTDERFEKSLLHTSAGIVLDIGTGDGRFVYQSARKNAGKYYIGIDAATAAVAETAAKVYKKPAKGGVPNSMFVQAAVESLPDELTGIADEVHVHFPWGTLLRAVAEPDVAVLQQIRKVCKPNALLEVILGIDEKRDATELQRLGISAPTLQRFQSLVIGEYAKAGFRVTEYGAAAPDAWPNLCTSWAKKLKVGETRTLLYLIAEAN